MKNSILTTLALLLTSFVCNAQELNLISYQSNHYLVLEYNMSKVDNNMLEGVNSLYTNQIISTDLFIELNQFYLLRYEESPEIVYAIDTRSGDNIAFLKVTLDDNINFLNNE